MLIFLMKIVALSYKQICSQILSKLEMIYSHLYNIFQTLILPQSKLTI